MLLHLIPRCLGPLNRYSAELLEFSVDGGLELYAGRHLRTAQPYPNKAYRVACRADSRTPENGLLVEADVRPGKDFTIFTTISRWGVEVGGRQWVSAHIVRYVLLDADHDAVSGEMGLWRSFQGWPSRCPEILQGVPASAQPTFPIFNIGPDGSDADDELFRRPDVMRGAIATRRQTFYLPTLERERLVRATSAEAVRQPQKLVDKAA